jgi:EAL domain-containing protein (putative c-di-GMP-specific phosphodiesterase class I)
MFCLDAELVRGVLDSDGIEIHFQPLVSLRRGSVFGVEALCRATDSATGNPIAPGDLFAAAQDPGLRLELDRRCRQEALAAFRPLYDRNPALVLAINVDASVIDSTSVHSRVLDRQVSEAGIPPENVAIEIIESQAGSALALMEFVLDYKRRGFVIALDDFGAGHSNLDRIPLLQPDMIKLDRSLISRIDRHFHKQEVVKSFVRLASRTGCLVLGEGVERVEEALTLLECGVDVFQGYHFGRPAPDTGGWPDAVAALNKVADLHKRSSIQRYNADKIRHSHFHTLVERICAQLAKGSSPDSLERTLEQRLTACMADDPQIECLYVLDMHGTQLSDTLCRPDRLQKSRRMLYEPAVRGTDHSCKEYFLPLRSGLSRFTTEPYLSLASGNRCITISTVFVDDSGEARILCVDLAGE